LARLTRYRAKRDFDQTQEPRGRVGRARGKASKFVIQRHDATRLHFDLRLELDGVYRSWAVTKVPSLDPAVKRLAVEVEDHPLDYGTFEGTIPQGQYGGGTVQLWDRGTWRPQSDTSPAKDLAEGHLKFEIDGERMRGGWALIRMRDRETTSARTPRHNWLLIKETDEFSRSGESDLLLKKVTSVKTGRTLEEIATGVKSRRAEKPRTTRTAKKARAAYN
jgi:bifunctional non-homologous end joining protein LigD